MNSIKTVITTILCLFLFCYQLANAQGHPIEGQLFNQIDEIEFTSDSKLIALQQKGDYLLHLLNEKSFELEKKLVRRGNGPGELQMAFAYYLDSKNNLIYLAGSDKRIIGVSLSEGKTIFEKTFSEIPTSIRHHSPSMLIHKGHLFLSNTHQLNPSEPTTKPLPIVTLYDTATTKLVYDYSLDMDQLAFPNLEDLRKANSITLSTFFLRINDRLSLIAIKGIPQLYFFVNGEFSKRIKLNPDFDVSFITSTREEFGDNIGIRTPAYINNLEMLNEQHILISYGNIHQEEIPLGYSIFRLKHTPRLGLQDEIQVEELFNKSLPEYEGISAFNITHQKNLLFLHNDFYWLAHEIYTVESSEIADILDP